MRKYVLAFMLIAVAQSAQAKFPFVHHAKKPPLAAAKTAYIPGSPQHVDAVQMALFKAIKGRLHIVHKKSQADIVIRLWAIEYRTGRTYIPIGTWVVQTPAHHAALKLAVEDAKTGDLIWWATGKDSYITKHFKKALGK